MASPHVLTLTGQNFTQEVLQSPAPVLVDFWAEWCGPCKMIAPVLDELADEFAGRVRIGKVNIDDDQSLAAQYGVRASHLAPVPTGRSRAADGGGEK